MLRNGGANITMKNKYFLTALLMIAMALFVGCHEDEEDQASNALVGDWYAEYAAPGTTGSGLAYDRMVQAYHFDDDGTGYWYNMYLADGNDEPVTMKGGHNIGAFAYTIADNTVSIRLNWENEVDDPAWSLEYANDQLTGSNGGTTYTLSRATAEQVEWCKHWDEVMNGGLADGIEMKWEEYEEVSNTRAIPNDFTFLWWYSDTLIVGNDNSAILKRVPVYPLLTKAYLSAKDLSTLEDGKAMWAASGMEIVSHGNAHANTFRFPSTFASQMLNSKMQDIPIPMYAYTTKKTNEGELNFRHVGAAVKMNIKNATSDKLVVDKVVVKSDKYQLSSPALYLDYIKDDLAYKAKTTTNAAYREVKVTFPSKGDHALRLEAGSDGSDIVVPILPIGDDNLTIEITTHMETDGIINMPCGFVYTGKISAQALSRGQMMLTSVTITPDGEGVTPRGAFSVDDGKAVFFSKANLKCTTDEYSETYGWVWNHWKFSFMDSQYEMHEDGIRWEANDPGDNYYRMNTITLFGYGTSGYNNGQECHQPNCADYRGWNDFYWDGEKYFVGHLTGNADWGYNAITNGGNKENSGWRTLTIENWIYLLNTRSGCEEKKALATVNGVKGGILLPDLWEMPAGLTWDANANRYASNVYSQEQWEAMENAGAIFLPAAGIRKIDNNNPTPSGLVVVVEGYQQEGMYWSSSLSADNSFAHTLYIVEDAGVDLTMEERQCGCSVRLVRDVKL